MALIVLCCSSCFWWMSSKTRYWRRIHVSIRCLLLSLPRRPTCFSILVSSSWFPFSSFDDSFACFSTDHALLPVVGFFIVHKPFVDFRDIPLLNTLLHSSGDHVRLTYLLTWVVGISSDQFLIITDINKCNTIRKGWLLFMFSRSTFYVGIDQVKIGRLYLRYGSSSKKTKANWAKTITDKKP